MALQNQSKNMTALFEEKSNLVKALAFVEKKIRLLRRKELEEPDTDEEPDYNSGCDEEDYVCSLRKRKTKKAKIIKRKDKNTKLFETRFNSSKRDKVKRAAKKTPRIDRPVQEIDTFFEEFDPDSDLYKACQCFICRTENTECLDSHDDKKPKKTRINLFEFFDPDNLRDLDTCYCISCRGDDNKTSENVSKSNPKNKWLDNHLREILELTGDW